MFRSAAFFGTSVSNARPADPSPRPVTRWWPSHMTTRPPRQRHRCQRVSITVPTRSISSSATKYDSGAGDPIPRERMRVRGAILSG